jgi:hypothetical protein
MEHGVAWAVLELGGVWAWFGVLQDEIWAMPEDGPPGILERFGELLD